jgi:hypothetical protein
MPIRARKTLRLGPLRLHLTRAGFSSWSLKVWRWSWNSRTRGHRVDLPGPFAWTSPTKRGHRRGDDR